ncbi:MAG: GNAT family N-acetyltransferase [Candidatus Bathyarchaeia archaeon]|nr:GNAT family N-acetyltransferase [Candidatus Bathyarchaeia archaeon]
MRKKVQYLVREGQEGKDEVKLAQILSECFDPATPRQVRRWLRQAKKHSAGWSRIFVGEVDGEVVSNVSVELKELHLGEGVYVKTGGIGGVCTCSDYRRKGIMTNLLQQCLVYVRNSGVSNSSLYTGLTLPAHRIYQRFGFCDIETWPVYIRVFDFDYVFQTWIRGLNRHLKFSKIARRTLQNWNRSVVFELGDVGVQSFRFKHGSFQRLSKPPKSADIVIATSVETLFRIMWGAIKFEAAIKKEKMQVKKGSETDLQMLKKILIRIWDE